MFARFEERPVWDDDPPTDDERPEMFSWAVVQRLNLDQRQHLDAVRTTYTTARLAQCADELQEGVDYLGGCRAARCAGGGGRWDKGCSRRRGGSIITND